MSLVDRKIEIYEIPPKEFKAESGVAGCYIEIERKLLLLQSSLKEKKHERWGLPAGKIQDNESPYEAAIRELFEETGIVIDDAIEVHSLGALYVRKPSI